ncbi:MAG: hypothetical protein CGW95_13805 [Phenylobacterium zucineum]|nr:MAG: hypothetical protein CGW95_13805 [Phenylobacterium zucineum]
MRIKKGFSPVDFRALADASGEESLQLESLFAGDHDDGLFAPNPVPDELILQEVSRPSPPRKPLTFTPGAEATFSPPPLAAAPTGAKATKQPFGLRPSLPKSVEPDDVPSGWPVYAVATFVSIIWALAPIAFAYGYRQAKAPFDFDPFVMTVLIGMAMGPAAFVWFAAYSIQQGRKLSVETQRAKAFTDQMIGPSLAAGIDAGHIVAGLREDIVATAAAADMAQKSILSVRQVLVQEGAALNKSTEDAVQVANTLTQTLDQQRIDMVNLAKTLDAQVRQIAETIGQNAANLARISQDADSQMKAAEILMATRTSSLSAATQEAVQATREAGEDLTRHIARIETAGLGLTDQIESVQKGLTEQRAGLVSVTHALRVDQEAFAAQAETHIAQLSDYIDKAKASAMDMADRVLQGGENLKEIIDEAEAQFRAMTEAARAEREAFARANQEALQAVNDAALLERKRLEDQAREAVDVLAQLGHQARLQSERHVDTLRDQVDRLSESAFVAGQKANQLFESRLSEAHDLIDRSAQLVEQAGAATARKLDEGADRARATLEDLSEMLSQIEARAARLPAAARGQAEQVRQAVAESMDDLLAQARRTAEETQAIDAAFQDRVRRNYDMLSDAVRLMGSVAGVAKSAQIQPSEPMAEEPPAAPKARKAQTAAAAPDDDGGGALDVGPAKRTRLKLTPTATEAEFDAAFQAAGGRVPAAKSTPKPAVKAPKSGREEWTWKDLLTSIDKPKSIPEPRSADHSLGRELEGLGIDAKALLPVRTIQDVAQALAEEDAEKAHQVVRRAAPAAIRRLARLMQQDADLRHEAVEFLSESQDALMEILQKNGPISSTVAYLNTEAGRLYLLFEAASADLA